MRVVHPENADELQEALLAGSRLFNRGSYFEAHEVWEDAWRALHGSERDFLRGLIQLAVALKKAVEGNPNGALRLLERANRLLSPYAPAQRNVDVAGVLQAMAILREQAAAWKAGQREDMDLTQAPPLPER